MREREREKYMKEAHVIGDIVAHPSLTGNLNLILINRSICFRLLRPLVSIHLLHHKKNKKKITSKPCIKQKKYIFIKKNHNRKLTKKFFFFQNENRKRGVVSGERRKKQIPKLYQIYKTITSIIIQLKPPKTHKY